ncbi:MAG: S8 family serine peptidase [Bacteroidales bacterium]|nr:S8 family serine peptidase [Bacteroidales bacterium]
MRRFSFRSVASSLILFLSSGMMTGGLSSLYAAVPEKYHPGGDEYEAEDDAPYLPSIVVIESDEAIADLVKKGAILLRERKNLALMYLPQSLAYEQEAKKKSPGKSGSARSPRLGKGRRVTPAMDVARNCFGASDILSGTDLPSSFSGKGVVVGICDIGFDPSHSNFKDPVTGENRIKRITQYKEAQGQRIVLETPEEYSKWVTDTTDHYHATHVAGILAGSDNSSGYAGVASGADIVVSVSQLSDVGLLAGVEDIIEYAHSVGKPAVVNLSMGNYTGPHDGTSLFSQYLDMLGTEAVICLSSGNAGGQTNSASFTFTDDQSSFGQRFHNYQWNQFDIEGMTDVWASDSKVVTLTPMVFDETTRETVYRFPSMRLTEGEIRGYYTDDDPIEGLEPADTDFRKYFSGWFAACGEVNADNRRYNIAIQYDLHTEQQSAEGAWARYNIAILLEGEPGSRVDVFSDGVTTRLREMPGSPAANSSLSVSDLATGHNVICVGMYNSRTTWPTLAGGLNSSNMETGIVNPHSSYGTLLDGRVLPHTVAPGNPIVSSFSGPYLEAHPDERNNCAAVNTFDGKSYYWLAEGGTSMSSPYVAGFIATFLEADLTLDVQQIKNMILTANRHDMRDPENPRHGNGWFDPRAVMSQVLSNTGVAGNSESSVRAYIEGRTLHIINPDEAPVALTICDINGRLLHSASASASEILTPIDSWQTGIMIIRIDSPQSAPIVLKTAA